MLRTSIRTACLVAAYCAATITWGQPAKAEVVGREIKYATDALSMQGYFAYDDALEGKLPGVIIVHEWWGHTDYVRQRARLLAKEGYAAFAIDMYGNGKTADHPKDAGSFAGAVTSNMDTAAERFQAALKVLKEQPQTDAKQIAAIGYCFGGGIVLEMARRGLALDGVASFHGSLKPVTKAEAGTTKAHVLVLHGAADAMVPPADVEALRTELQQAKVDFDIVEYPGVGHSFTNPAADEYAKKFELPVGYDKQADENSWERLLEFLEQIFAER
ncbi:MAG: dienelactone hydrolase family protein [Bdellovibrionales bacterium]|nr:dienelactone hydrolase family protein [Bdellovibrionales bacterium]